MWSRVVDLGLKVISHLRFFRRELLCKLFFWSVITIVWTIAGVNALIWYNATHYYANSSRLENRRCELALMNGQISEQCVLTVLVRDLKKNLQCIFLEMLCRYG